MPDIILCLSISLFLQRYQFFFLFSLLYQLADNFLQASLSDHGFGETANSFELFFDVLIVMIGHRHVAGVAFFGLLLGLALESTAGVIFVGGTELKGGYFLWDWLGCLRIATSIQMYR